MRSMQLVANSGMVEMLFRIAVARSRRFCCLNPIDHAMIIPVGILMDPDSRFAVSRRQPRSLPRQGRAKPGVSARLEIRS
jgi:hypothetical protein